MQAMTREIETGGTISAATTKDRMDNHSLEQAVKGNESLVTCENSQGIELRATLIHIGPYRAVFEIYNPQAVLRVSEVLKDFRVLVAGQPLYLGRAVISSIVHGGTLLVCEASLQDPWIDPEALTSVTQPDRLQASFEGFLRE